MTDPVIPQKKPYVLNVVPGRYSWCACGKSAKQPYCDASHKGTEFMPIVEEFKEEKKVAWCGCKHTSTKPFCDGKHKSM